MIETSPLAPWSWRDRRFVVRCCRDTAVTHYVYASEADPLLGEAWREPFAPAQLDRWADLVEGRFITLGLALAPDDDVDPDDPAELAALFAKADQVLDLGFELLLVRFDRAEAVGSPIRQARLAAALADHVGGRADVVVAPKALTQTTPGGDLAAFAEGLPDDVAVAWCGPDTMPDEITRSDLDDRAAALGGRPPLVWDEYGVNHPLAADRLPVGPYAHHAPEVLAGAAGWLVTAPRIARAAVVRLPSFSAWAHGGDPEAAWRDAAGELRVFVEACEGGHPRRLVDEALAALGTPGWADALVPLISWLEQAAVAATPLLGNEIAPWRRQVRSEASLCLLTARLVQLTAPLATLDARGHGRVVGPDLPAVVSLLAYAVNAWRTVSRKVPVVLGERQALAPRIARADDGTLLVAGPFLLEGANATDRLVRALTAWVTGLDPEGAELAVEVEGTALPVDDDGTFRAPPGSSVVVRWGDRSATRVTPGWTPPFPDDARLPGVVTGEAVGGATAEPDVAAR